MANEQNLIPFGQRSEKEERAMRVKGGINSGKARKEKATWNMILNQMLSAKVKDKKQLDKMKDYGVEENEATVERLLLFSLLKKSIAGDMFAFKELSKITGNDVPSPDEYSARALEKIAETMKEIRDK